MYYGLLRVGEIAMSDHVLKAKDLLKFRRQKLMLVFYTSKTHSVADRPQKIRIQAIAGTSEAVKRIYCPVDITLQFLELRPAYLSDNEQLLVHQNGSPLKPNEIRIKNP